MHKPKIKVRTRADRRRRARRFARERFDQRLKDMRLTHGLYEESLLPGYLQGYNDALTDLQTTFPSEPAARLLG